jgi:uncharacterized protein YjlB
LRTGREELTALRFAILGATTAQQQQEIQTLTATVREQASQIQKVTAPLEASKPTPRVQQSLKPRPPKQSSSISQ